MSTRIHTSKKDYDDVLDRSMGRLRKKGDDGNGEASVRFEFDGNESRNKRGVLGLVICDGSRAISS
jgi:hypothetical protein